MVLNSDPALDLRARILIVDDFSTMRRIIRNLLLDMGFEAGNLCEASDGKQAMDALTVGRFDLLITDWNMPQMTGIDLLRTLRAHATLAQLPVLMVTAENNRAQIIAAAQAGVNGYIVKPFSASTLKDKLVKIFEQSPQAEPRT